MVLLGSVRTDAPVETLGFLLRLVNSRFVGGSGSSNLTAVYSCFRPKPELGQIAINDTNFALAILRGQPLARGQFTAAEMQQKLDSME